MTEEPGKMRRRIDSLRREARQWSDRAISTYRDGRSPGFYRRYRQQADHLNRLADELERAMVRRTPSSI